MNTRRERSNTGSSLLEFLLSVLIILIFAGASLSLYTANLKRYSSEQQTAEINQAARNALELMSMEIQQAGSHPDVGTTASAAINGSNTVQTVTLASTTGLNVGDWLTIDPGAASEETFKVTALNDSASTVSGKIQRNHAISAPVRLFAQPYLTGIIVPIVGGSPLGSNSSATTNTIKFYGDISGDGSLYYVEYTYNASTSEILRSITPLSSSTKAAATSIAENVTSHTFTLYTDSWGVVTKVGLRTTVNSTDPNRPNQVTMSSTVIVRNVAAASSMAVRVQQYVMPNYLPPTPTKVVTWSS